MCLIITVVEGESGPDKTALTAGALAGGICVIIVSPLVFVLVFLDCKRYVHTLVNCSGRILR